AIPLRNGAKQEREPRRGQKDPGGIPEAQPKLPRSRRGQKSSIATVTGVRFTQARRSGALARLLPFAVYLFFLALAEVIAWVSPHLSAVAALGLWGNLWVYPLKTVAVLAVLVYFWPCYDELNIK